MYYSFSKIVINKTKITKVESEVEHHSTENPMYKVYNEVFEITRKSIKTNDSRIENEDSYLFDKKNITSFLLLLAFSIHALFEGMALGLVDDEREMLYMILAISLHKWVEALSIVFIVVKLRE